MKSKGLLLVLSSLSAFFSPLVYAHITPAGEGPLAVLLHPFTGFDHVPMLIFVGVGIAYFIRKQHQTRD